ncbi:hypothetical protein D1007_45180 [Hordeum vulgare]|nr:hypothetical protein D1007_45180 [Hordeum vulgare]
MKTMPIKSNLHWVAYKEAVASSIDKSLEVFATTVVNAPLHVDLNQPIVDDLSPYNGVAPIVEHKVEVQVNEYPQYEFGGSAPIKDDGHESDEEYERQHNIVGDVEAQVRHDDMDPDIVYQRACVDESDDEGPVNELDEDGFIEKEAEWYTKITGRDHKVPLFSDFSLADKALVEGGMSKTIEDRMFPSSTPNAISTSYLKKGLMFEDILEFKMWLCEYAVKHYRPFRVAYSNCHKRYTVKCEVWRRLNPTRRKWSGVEKDAASEEQRLMERAAKKLREQDAAEAKKMERERQYEEFEAKRKEDLKLFLKHCAYEKKMKDKHKKAMEQRHNECATKFKIAMAKGAAKREWEEELFMERVLEEASKMHKREDEEEEERKKKKGKGPCSTQ